MAFSHENAKGVTYYLHGKERITKSGKSSWLYYFAKEEKPEGGLPEVPKGYMVVENKNGLPLLKKEA
jgi:hypothetical protein